MALTPYQTVYDAFLAKIEEDEWAWADDSATVEADWKALLDSALAYIKFPRVNFKSRFRSPVGVVRVAVQRFLVQIVGTSAQTDGSHCGHR